MIATAVIADDMVEQIPRERFQILDLQLVRCRVVVRRVGALKPVFVKHGVRFDDVPRRRPKSMVGSLTLSNSPRLVVLNVGHDEIL